MLIKFESKSNRVKGVSFHPKRPWVLSALHNGTIQLWDYRMGTLIDKFEEHDGPVRGVSFHNSQPLFVSGGDDYKIKVWNYKQRRCLFTLTGHLDYIRTVFFHHEYPWIISASDDQTIRIWNWQARQCISILTGHNHYVMCAQFHPKEDLVVSASLDQTVRVWDITGLRKKNSAPSSTFAEDLSRNSANHADIFGNTDVLVKYVLEGHERGVNWACFHPTMPLIVSGADDRQVKLWRMSDTKAWEVDTCRGHYNNVSCALFHPRQELIVSNSEDKSIRVWDMSKRSGVQTFRRESERFWVLAAHPELNLFAAGHDCGLIVFKLERERPAYAVYQTSLYYVKDKTIRLYDFQSGADVPVIGIRKTAGLNTQPRSLSYNPAENAVLLITGSDGASYELYQLPKQAIHSAADVRDASNDCRSGPANGAIFVARNRYVILNKSQQLLAVHTIGSDAVRTMNLSGTVTDVFFAGTGQVLLSTINSVVLYDLQQQGPLAELQGVPIKYAYWNSDMTMVALIAKHTIVIASKKLEQMCLIHETIRIKSGVWDDSGVFVYSTLNHIKYALPQGDNGIIRTLEQPLYVVRAAGKTLHCLDRDAKVRLLTIEPAEYRFKLALVKRQYDEVLHMIRNSNLVGQSIIAYLRNKGFPEVALHFVRDAQTRFDLALECGNLTAAMDSAKTLESETCWSRLAMAALRHGNQQIVETAYQRVKNFERLSFLYLITGQTDKLKKMIKIAELRNDPLSQFQNSVLIGDVEEQIRVYRAAGQDVLAYWMAKNHGLRELCEDILEVSGKTIEEVAPLRRTSSLLSPPCSTLPAAELAENWPQLAVSRGIFETAGFVSHQENEQNLSAKPLIAAVHATEKVEVIGDWGDGDIDDDVLGGKDGHKEQVVTSADAGGSEGGWDIDDVDLSIATGASDLPQSSVMKQNVKKFELPKLGASPNEDWVKNSQLAVDHVAAGSFESAMQILNRKFGIVNFGPLKEYFIAVFMGVKVSQSVLGTYLSLGSPLIRNWQNETGEKMLPLSPFKFQTLLDLLQSAYQETTSGRFAAALEFFARIIHFGIFTVAMNRNDAEELRQMIGIAREYILGLMIETARKELPVSDPTAFKRNVELAAYFTHCELQPAHSLLSLQVAMAQAYKAKCFATAAIMIRRLLELGPPPQLAQKARQIQAIVEKAPVDELQLAYEPLNPFCICAGSFTPIYKGNAVCQCEFCGASYLPDYQGKLCRICQIAVIGPIPK